ncbi:962_t:CDS:2, partial [Racocetra persica]
MKELQDKGLGEIKGSGGEHYNLKIDQFNFCDDGGIDFQRFRAKNNQRRVIGGAAQKVPILADSSNFRGPCYDYHLYFKKRPLDANQEFYLQTNPK